MRRLATCLAFLLLAAPALAQQSAPCGPHERVPGILGERFGESMQARGVMANGSLEVWANPATGTWTVVIVAPDGEQSCFAAEGRGFVSGDDLLGDPA